MGFKQRFGSEGTLSQAGDAYPVIISATAPTTSTFPDLIVGQLWLDTTGPTLKRCTNASTPTYAAVEADITTHEADVTTHGITAAAATVLDDATVSAMVDTLGGAASTGSGGLVRATSPALTTPTGIVKGDVGLGNVDNTTDAGKPVSTAQQTALDLKGNITSQTFVTPNIGVASATSVNKVAITAPATSSTLTIADGQTLTVNGSATITNGTHSGTNTGDQTLSGLGGANTALSNLASVAINLPLLPDAAAADDFGSATLPFKDIFLAGSSGTPGTNNFKITGASTSGTRVITLPNASDTLVGKDTTDTMTNKTLTSPTMTAPALGTPASGVMTNVTGLTEAGQTLADNTTNNASTTKHGYLLKLSNVSTEYMSGTGVFSTPAGGTTTPKMVAATVFEASGRFQPSVGGSGAQTYGAEGIDQTTGATGTSYVKIIWYPGGNNGSFAATKGSPSASFETYLNTVVTLTGDAVFFVGDVTVDGTAVTYTSRHVGFKFIGDGATTKLYATQADNTTENASASLATMTQYDIMDLVLQVNTTVSTDYYTRSNSGAFSAATNLTTNMPTTSNSGLMLAVTNKATANAVQYLSGAASYQR